MSDTENCDLVTNIMPRERLNSENVGYRFVCVQLKKQSNQKKISKLKLGKGLRGTKIHSGKLNLDFTAYIQDETSSLHPKCFIMTIHDLGCDCKLILNCIV